MSRRGLLSSPDFADTSASSEEYYFDPTYGGFLHVTEVVSPEMCPDHFYQRAAYLSKLQIVSALQNNFHDLLSQFVNVVPFAYVPSLKRLRRPLETLAVLLRRLPNNHGQSYSCHTKLADLIASKLKQRFLSKEFIAQALVSLYEVIHPLLKTVEVDDSQKIPRSRDFHEQEFSGVTLNILKELRAFVNTNLKDCLLGFYIHGSVSSRDSTFYSDLDTLAIIRDSVFENKRTLVDFQRKLFQSTAYLYRFDELQHHGHFIVCEQDLACYSQCYFPIQIFPYATSLIEPAGGLNYSRRDSAFESRVILWKSILFFRNAHLRATHPRNLYLLKQYLSMLMLQPALVLQVVEEPCYKGESFARARKYYREEEWEAQEVARRIRSEWPRKLSGQSSVRKRIPRGTNPLLIYGFNRAVGSRPIPSWLQRYIAEDLYGKAFLFSEGSRRMLSAPARFW